MIILIGVALIICFVFYYTMLTASKPNKNILLNTTLPISAFQNDTVLNIVKDFKRANNIYLIASLVIFIASFLIISEGLSVFYFCSWIAFQFLVYYLLQKKYINKIRKLKMDNNWFVENKHIISIDTEVSKEKNKMPISILWFIPSFFISTGLVIYGLCSKSNSNGNIVLFGCISIFTTIVFLFAYKILSAERTKVYSNDSSINLACNLVYRRIWSIVFVLLSATQTILSLLNTLVYSYMIISSLFMSILTIVAILTGYIKIRNIQNRLLLLADNSIYADDDEYWGILYYNNPNDSSLMVEKRIGIGLTFNIGNPKGKIIMAINILIVILSFSISLGGGYMMFKLTNSNYNLSVDNNIITIDAPIYGTHFNENDIKEISLISSLPKGERTNGFENSHIALGNFKFDGYGSSKAFIHKGLGKTILIKLSDKYVFLTGNSDEETNAYFNELQSYLNKK